MAFIYLAVLLTFRCTRSINKKYYQGVTFAAFSSTKTSRARLLLIFVAIRSQFGVDSVSFVEVLVSCDCVAASWDSSLVCPSYVKGVCDELPVL